MPKEEAVDQSVAQILQKHGLSLGRQDLVHVAVLSASQQRRASFLGRVFAKHIMASEWPLLAGEIARRLCIVRESSYSFLVDLMCGEQPHPVNETLTGPPELLVIATQLQICVFKVVQGTYLRTRDVNRTIDVIARAIWSDDRDQAVRYYELGQASRSNAIPNYVGEDVLNAVARHVLGDAPVADYTTFLRAFGLRLRADTEVALFLVLSDSRALRAYGREHVSRVENMFTVRKGPH